MQFVRSNYWGIAVVLTTMVLAGLWIDIRRGRKRSVPETMLNLSVFSIGFLLNNLVYKAWQLMALGFFSQFMMLQIPVNIWTFAFVFVAVDFIYYWRHRVEHMIPLLWAEHSVHHSSHEFNFSTALRLPWVTPLFGWIVFVPLIIIGFPPLAVFVALQINLLFQYFIHSDEIGKLGVVEGYLNTPSNHRVHHASNAKYIDKNFAGVFIFWDRLFGSYAAEEETPVYGAKYTLPHRDPFTVNLYPIYALLRDASREKSFRGVCRKLLMPLKT